jgi:hypothetical protein
MTRPRRDSHQRLAYAAHRVSLAIDRIITSTSRHERDKASLWAKAWARRAGMLGAQGKLPIPI